MAVGLLEVYRRRGVDTVVTFPGILVTTGAVATGATWTVTGGGSAINAAPVQGSVNASTVVAEDGTTGIYNFTIKAADNANEKSVFKLVPSTANMQTVVVVLYTAHYMSYLDIASATAAQPAVKLVGNTSGQGLYIGAGTGDAAYIVSGSGMALRLYSSSHALYAECATSGAGAKFIGGGGYPAIWGIGGASSSAAGAAALLLTGGESTWNNAGGKGGAGISAGPGASHANATGLNPALNIVGLGTGAGALIKSGSGATGNAVEFTAASTNGSALSLTATGTGVEILGSGNAELAALPGSTPSLLQMVQFLYEYSRNKNATTLAADALYKDNGTDVLGTAAISTDGTTTTKARMA